MKTIDEVKSIQERINTKNGEFDRAAGRKDQLLTQLKTDYDCDDTAAAQILVQETVKTKTEKMEVLVNVETEINGLLAEGIV